MESAKSCIAGTKTCIAIAAKDPPRTLRVLSTVSGLLLILGGIAGIFTINPLSAIISVYNILFGLLIVLTELKSWPIIRTFQRRVDIYFHLLSVPRGKGGFYCFIGFLAFFSSDWSLARICVLIVSIVGVLHLFACKRCGAPGDEEQGGTAQVQPIQFSAGGGANPAAEELPDSWQGLMKQVVSESPEMLAAGLSSLGGATGAVSGAASVLAASAGGPAPPAAPSAGAAVGSGMTGSDVLPPPAPLPPPPQSPAAAGSPPSRTSDMED